MLHDKKNAEAPAYFYNDHLLTVEYSFSDYEPAKRRLTNSNVWLDILFVHPRSGEAVTIRTAKSTLILCQSKEVIETVVHREIRQFLQQAMVEEYGAAYTNIERMPALAKVA